MISRFGTGQAGLEDSAAKAARALRPEPPMGWFRPWNPKSRRGQAAFGNVSLTALKLSTAMSLSSVPVSR